VSTSALRRIRAKAKAEQGYEDRPPRCLNCNHYSTPQHGTPDRKAFFQPAMCGLGGFPVRPFSICDQWTGSDGSTIE